VRTALLDPATATDADVAAIHGVLSAAAAVDRPADPPPLLEIVEARLRFRRDDVRRTHVVVLDGDTVVGYATLRLSLVDNPHLGLLQTLTVHPGHRRRGAGTALLRVTLAEMAAGGRPVLIGESVEGTAGDGFAGALDARLVQTDRLSLLRFADVRWPDVEAVADAKHPGYRVEAWLDRCPDELLDGYATAKSAMNDAPHDDADLGDFLYTADTVRADEAAGRVQGQVRVVVAVHEETGAVAGFTEVLVGRDPHRSFQEDTAVVPAHRGSGLGLWIKSDMLVRLRAGRPDVAELLTGNATTNRHMLAINDRLGFRPWSRINGWQADVPTLTARLG
jgi:GNAT superfamily N-acetyltransferase